MSQHQYVKFGYKVGMTVRSITRSVNSLLKSVASIPMSLLIAGALAQALWLKNLGLIPIL